MLKQRKSKDVEEVKKTYIEYEAVINSILQAAKKYKAVQRKFHQTLKKVRMRRRAKETRLKKANIEPDAQFKREQVEIEKMDKAMSDKWITLRKVHGELH